MLAAMVVFGVMPQAEYRAPSDWDSTSAVVMDARGGQKGKIVVRVDPTAASAFMGTEVPTVQLVNLSSKSLSFSSCDQNIPLIREAKDSKGKWRPIEWLSVGECGGKASLPKLATGKMWVWPIAMNSGGFKTQVRFAVESGGKIYRSAPYADSIDPGQFQLEDGLRGSKLIRVGLG